MRLLFSHRHPNDLVGVGGNLFPRCKQCGVQTHDAGSARQEATASCRSQAEWRDRHAVTARCAAATEQEFAAYTNPLRRVEIFKYLRRLIVYDDTDVPAARRQLSRTSGVKLHSILTAFSAF